MTRFVFRVKWDCLRAVKAAAILAIATCLCLLLLDARALLKAQNGVAQREGAKTRDLADRHLKQIEQDLRLREDAAIAEVKALHASADRQLSAATTQVADMREMVDRRTGDLLARYDTTEADANRRLAEVTGAIVGLKTDLKPTLDQAAALTGHADALVSDLKDSWDDNYDDIKATVSSATVAVAGIGRASDEVAKAAPELNKASVSIAGNFARAVDDATKPKHWWEKILGPAYTIGRLIAIFF